MTKDEQRFRALDGLAQKARGGELTMPEVNLALSILLENELEFLNAKLGEGVVTETQDDTITHKVRRTPVGGVKGRLSRPRPR